MSDQVTTYWFRLPEGEVVRLRRAYLETDHITLIQMMNRYRITACPLSLCCDLEAAYYAVRDYLKSLRNE